MSDESQSATPETTARILIADDDPAVRTALSRVLRNAGHEVTLAEDGEQALRVFGEAKIDLILSDVVMPNVDGLALLKSVRERSADIPFILLAGAPTTDSAIGAVHYRATEYLPKPVKPQELIATVNHALRLRRLASVRQQAMALHTASMPPAGDEKQALARNFERALAALFMVYQPIIDWSRRVSFGYEALVRSAETSLPHPGAIFDAAEKLDRLHDLGAIIREKCGEPLDRTDPDASLFVNLHTNDLLDERLYDPNAPLSKIASRVVLEITERANIEKVKDVQTCVTRLRALGFRIAIDDIGAGYSGLNSFALVQPDVLKLDITLVRDIDTNVMKRKLVDTLLGLCTDLGITVIAEGVETVAERNTLVELGCNYLQGYLFARPGAPFPDPRYT